MSVEETNIPSEAMVASHEVNAAAEGPAATELPLGAGDEIVSTDEGGEVVSTDEGGEVVSNDEGGEIVSTDEGGEVVSNDDGEVVSNDEGAEALAEQDVQGVPAKDQKWLGAEVIHVAAERVNKDGKTFWKTTGYQIRRADGRFTGGLSATQASKKLHTGDKIDVMVIDVDCWKPGEETVTLSQKAIDLPRLIESRTVLTGKFKAIVGASVVVISRDLPHGTRVLIPTAELPGFHPGLPAADKEALAKALEGNEEIFFTLTSAAPHATKPDVWRLVGSATRHVKRQLPKDSTWRTAGVVVERRQGNYLIVTPEGLVGELPVTEGRLEFHQPVEVAAALRRGRIVMSLGETVPFGQKGHSNNRGHGTDQRHGHGQRRRKGQRK